MFMGDGVQDGFIHLTADPNLLLEVANRFYSRSQGDWEVLVIDPAKLTAEVSDPSWYHQTVIDFEVKACVAESNSSDQLTIAVDLEEECHTNDACVYRSSLKLRRQLAVQQPRLVTTADGRTYMAH